MTSELDFFTQAQNASDIYTEAAKHGRKVGRPPIFYAADAPAHLRNRLVQRPTMDEWQARMDRNAADPIIQKFGPGMTVMNLYYDPVKRAHAMPDDPPSELMKTATPDELRILWDQWFATHGPEYKHGLYTAKFTHALKAEAARRGVTLIFKN